ncbi:hypothetical protein [Sphingomonas psychrotolerans]|uniref:Uncharacterized protein n=1 Tax=Sphingomonas psychrotolerans TaxID=1327635 RepID=A0A2K8MIT7_9SPHN|nr:hypothetical protein [Sphingomonas psychrotolerans]ATY33798.1 hypothetical protein CVN68_19060 [Sphingomonas psychrotolerans]
MTNLVKKAVLGTVLGASVLVAVAPTAEAQRYGYRDRYYHRDRGDAGTAIVAGIAGLAIGAALAGGDRYDRRYDYDRRYYRERGYYPTDGYYYRDYQRRYRGGWDRCTVRRVYDPYLDRRVRVRYCR